MHAFQVICLPPGNECTEKIKIDSKKCVQPCNGVYADVRQGKARNITGDQLESLMFDYNKFKRFGELSKSKKILDY